MPAAKAPRAKAGGSARARKPQAVKLPPITVARFEETGLLLERVVASTQAQFIEHGQAYKEQHRQGSSRPLTASEAAHVATALSKDTAEDVAEIQGSDLRAYDQPELRETLLAAGLRTAPEIVRAFREVVALIEMPASDFEEACNNDTLPEAVAAAAEDLRHLELADARARTSAAMAHYAQAAGFDPGEAMSLPLNAVWQALRNAASQLEDASQFSQLIGSAASITGPDETSSTG